jgi:hypothetical protein
MPHDLWRVVLIAFIGVALVTPTMADTTVSNPAQGLASATEGVVIGIVMVGVALAVGITLLILHEKHKTAEITGCVASGATGMTVMDEKDKRVYSLSGDPVGVKPGDRIVLEGRRRGIIFDVRSVIKDFGVCPP